ncbi:MAG: response regulator [Bacteroidetes bacterium]|nr:response regulator [Bacteroidota bacterium]
MENKKIKILAIDDNQDNLISLKALLKEAFPFSLILTAINGAIGLELAETEDPDVILLDIVMPRMDGFEVCKKIKANKKLNNIPIVFITALKVDKESRIRALELGAEAFIAKPIDESELIAQIRAMVKIKASNIKKRDEKELLAALVAKRTYDLEMELAERKRIEVELIKAKEKAEESDRLKSAFLANMSHEIRTPMNGILGFAELLKEPNLTGSEQQDYIKIIEKSGKRMLNIINDIINISKIESGQEKITISETNINEQIEFIYTFFKCEVEKKGIQLLYNNSLPTEESVIKTDSEKIYAILTNLVKNAIKFTSEGYIKFGYEKKGEYLEFFVKDTGTGINPAQKEIIFERFRQGSESLSRNYEGAGLGLSISKAYIEMLGGKIWVESELENLPALPADQAGEQMGGSTFYFTIPYNGIIEEQNINKNINYNESENIEINNLKILIAEDDALSKMLIILAIENFCSEILKVSTGFEAVEACRNNPDIDLVLMDIKMPEMDGYEAIKQIRQFNKKIIIIAQTAYALSGDREKAMDAGCNDYVSKPIIKPILIELIKKYFANRDQ